MSSFRASSVLGSREFARSVIRTWIDRPGVPVRVSRTWQVIGARGGTIVLAAEEGPSWLARFERRFRGEEEGI